MTKRETHAGVVAGLVLAIIVTIGLGLVCAPANAATYYLDGDTGNDSDTGLTRALAWKQLDVADAKMSTPGDTLVIIGELNVTNQGTGRLDHITFGSTGITVMGDRENGQPFVIDFSGYTTMDRFWESWEGKDDTTLEYGTIKNWDRNASAKQFLYMDGNNDGFKLKDMTFDTCWSGSSNLIDFRGTGLILENVSFYGGKHVQGAWVLLVNADDSQLYNVTFGHPDEMAGAAAGADTLGRGEGPSIITSDRVTIDGMELWNIGENQSRTFASGQASTKNWFHAQGCSTLTVSNVKFHRYLHGREGNYDDGLGSAMAGGDFVVNMYSAVPSWDVHLSNFYIHGGGHGIQVADANRVTISYVVTDSTFDDSVFLATNADTVTVHHLLSHYSQNDVLDIQGDNVTAYAITGVNPADHHIGIGAAAENVSVTDFIAHEMRDIAGDGYLLQIASGATNITFDRGRVWDTDAGDRQYDNQGAVGNFAAFQTAGWMTNGVEASTSFVNLPDALGAFRDHHNLRPVIGTPPILGEIPGFHSYLYTRFVRGW